MRAYSTLLWLLLLLLLLLLLVLTSARLEQLTFGMAVGLAEYTASPVRSSCSAVVEVGGSSGGGGGGGSSGGGNSTTYNGESGFDSRDEPEKRLRAIV